MKKVLIAVVAVGVFALAGAMPAYAQQGSRVSVPFQFIVGDRVLPAGTYLVSNPAFSRDIVTIQSADGKVVTSAFVQPTGDAVNKPKATFVFQKIGGQYFLSQVSLPEFESRALSLPKSQVSAMLAKLNGNKVHTGPAL